MHILRSQQFNRELLQEMFNRAETFDQLRRTDSGRHQIRRFAGKVAVNLFYTESLRTHMSFKFAERHLGMEIDGSEDAGQFSSLYPEYRNRGESLEDTTMVINSYFTEADGGCIVLRHPEEGAAERAAKISRIPIINAGDGKGQHPTQSLIDVGMINRTFGTVDGLVIIIGGDLAYGRTARSLAYLLSKFKGVRILFISPPELKMKNDVLEHLCEHDVAFAEHDTLEDVIADADVVYWTRAQKEKADEGVHYKDISNRFCIDATMMRHMKEDALLLHPLPRNEEIHPEVDSDPRAGYFRQTEYSIPMRMALLELAMGGNLRAQSLAYAA